MGGAADVAAFPGHLDGADRDRHAAADDHDPAGRELGDLGGAQDRDPADGDASLPAVLVIGRDVLVPLTGERGVRRAARQMATTNATPAVEPAEPIGEVVGVITAAPDDAAA